MCSLCNDQQDSPTYGLHCVLSHAQKKCPSMASSHMETTSSTARTLSSTKVNSVPVSIAAAIRPEPLGTSMYVICASHPLCHLVQVITASSFTASASCPKASRRRGCSYQQGSSWPGGRSTSSSQSCLASQISEACIDLLMSSVYDRPSPIVVTIVA